jgi:hypothetical protein
MRIDFFHSRRYSRNMVILASHGVPGTIVIAGAQRIYHNR